MRSTKPLSDAHQITQNDDNPSTMITSDVKRKSNVYRCDEVVKQLSEIAEMYKKFGRFADYSFKIDGESSEIVIKTNLNGEIISFPIQPYPMVSEKTYNKYISILTLIALNPSSIYNYLPRTRLDSNYYNEKISETKRYLLSLGLNCDVLFSRYGLKITDESSNYDFFVRLTHDEIKIQIKERGLSYDDFLKIYDFIKKINNNANEIRRIFEGLNFNYSENSYFEEDDEFIDENE